jgi:hypothetical protein
LKGNRLGIYVPEYPSSIYVYVDQAYSGELIVELTSFVQRYRVVRISSNLEAMVIKESGFIRTSWWSMDTQDLTMALGYITLS